MSLLEISFYPSGTIFFFSALAFAYYAFNNARLMRGPLGHQLMALGGGLFIATALLGGVDHFFVPGSGLVYTEFFIWIAALLAIVGGGVLRAKEVQRVNRAPLFRILLMTPHARNYLLGIAALTFISLPLSTLSISSSLRSEPNWLDAGSMIVWAFAFAIMAVAERRFHHVVRSSLAATAEMEKEEERLLREDILALRMYSDFASKMSATIIPVVGIETLRQVLRQCAAEHDILEDCKITDAGNLITTAVAQNLLDGSEQQGVSKVLAGFLTLISKFIHLYSAVASTDLAREMVEKNYRAAKERYADVSTFPQILQAIPKGFLEEERIALLSKAELEVKVRERTQELEVALARVGEATEALRASRASFHNIVQRSTDGIVVIDREGLVHFVNPAAETYLGREAKTLVGATFPVDINSVTELDITHRDGEKGVAELHVVETEWEDKMAYLALLHDITERVRAGEQIRASLKEKEVLLKEIHHRVKNNLQIISSLIMLQSGYIKERQTLENLKDIQNRIRAMALIHERLYRSEDLTGIDLAQYVQELTTFLVDSHQADLDLIRTKIHAEHVFLGIDMAIPSGLILNELVSNALKHAFPDGQAGEICIGLDTNCDHELVLSVGDDGVGLPPHLDFRNTPSLGLQLVNDLVQQLEGAIELDRSRGTEFKVRFGLPRQKS